MPGMIYKFNPENSDFPVGNFLTTNKKGHFLWKSGLKIFIPVFLKKTFSCVFVVFQIYINTFLLDINILFNQIVYVDIMLNNSF